jgi:ADP-ribosylglycohydrolase
VQNGVVTDHFDPATPLRERALGAVLGSAVGDALGAPFEFGPAGQYSARFPTPVLAGAGEMIGGGSFRWAPGEFTDDTQMAIVQAESLLDRGGVDGADLFRRFGTWAALAADVGIQTGSVLSSGLPWDQAAAEYVRHNPRAAGNGALMRATPSAVHYASAPLDETIDAARQLAAITHGDPSCGWGTAIHHAMVRAALAGDDPFALLGDVLRLLPDDQARYRRMLAADWTPDQMEASNGTVWGCLAHAVWSVRSTSSFVDAVTTAIDLGGDTDTVAAVAGGLAGAIYGIESIPTRWTVPLHGHVDHADGRRTYRAHDLRALTLRLLAARDVDDRA